ncbi:hypothetical protein CC78DRAFT_547254 [Lojkania enalia]|uniref:Zn(2)-C6 fungal-type domain-containing protein n=1 Tax=Lojkania enalia TaxID=147567 RepID=A0A9P4K261_9PLEO|nr:hypothetical protein CC78DRAFT_547254 [Didymosphaeria enalia]
MATHSAAGDGTPATNSSGAATNPKMRKRTKTGCLTCRKRRIKCGEERPTCANCIKSKRQCEGYNQRVIFKPPIGDWPNHQGVVVQYHSSLLPGARVPGSSQAQQESTLSSIQPRPGQFDFSKMDTRPVPSIDHSNALNTQQAFTHQFSQDTNYQQPLRSPHHQPALHSPHHQPPTPTSATSYFPQQSPIHASFQSQQYPNEQNARYSMHQQYPQGGSYETGIDQRPVITDASHPTVSQAYQELAVYHPQGGGGISEEQNPYLLSSAAPSRMNEYPQYSETRPSLNRYGSNTQVTVSQSQLSPVNLGSAVSYAPSHTIPHTDHTHSSFQTVQIPPHDVSPDVKYVPQHAVLEQPTALPQTQRKSQPQLLLHGFGGDDHVSPTQVLDEAAIEYEDDDYYDVHSDEEMLDGVEADEDMMITSRDFSLIQRLHRESLGELSIRRYDAFINENILHQYRAENVANPLKNPKTARVFAHFIFVTGPSLSIYERNPSNPNSIFEGPTPPSQQNLWTYILPLKALKHQGLLHAMLALSSLHIAKLQRASPTPSYKHYAYAIKRLHRSLSNSKKRLQVPTLATALLLAFYEVMTAEHVKWSTHLVGAAQLLAELDFRSLTQEARRLKAEQTAQDEKFPYRNPSMLIDQREYEQNLKASAMMPDEITVSTIVGKKVSYDDFGRVLEEPSMRQEKKRKLFEKFDLRLFETSQDLHWWYARQDAFQSIVSGNPLIMDYRKWSDCPPRAPLGRTDALFGSHDHIILLIGRIAEFTARDRERKLRQQEADGGTWRPRPGMPGMPPMGQPPSQDRRQSRQSSTPATPTGPSSQGMGGPPPGWTGPPPPGWKGGPPPGWTRPPPPGWSGGPPPQMMPSEPEPSQPQMGPPHVSETVPPPGWKGPPPPGWMGGPPPGWTGPPPPPPPPPLGWSGDPPQASPTGPPPSKSQIPPPGSVPQGQGQGQGQAPGHGIGQVPRGPPPIQGPGFYGMAPSRGKAPLPTSFANPDFPQSPKSPISPTSKYPDLEAAYEVALSDWNSIQAAHDAVAQTLINTPGFQTLPPEMYQIGPGANMTPFGPALVHRSYDISILWAHLHLAQIILLRSHPAMPPAAHVAAGFGASATAPYATLIGRIAASIDVPMDENTPLTPQLGAALIESTMSLFFAGIQYHDPHQRDWLITRLVEIDRRTGWASAAVIARACETSWETSAKMGVGPAYERRTRRFGEEGPIVPDANSEGTEGGGWGGEGIIRNPRKTREREDGAQRKRDQYEGDEMRFVVRYNTGLVPWAMNLLATDEDLRIGMERVVLGPAELRGVEKERSSEDEEMHEEKEYRN